VPNQSSIGPPLLAPPVTPREAKLVWDRMPNPSARRVATALTQSGRRVHFSTIARWRLEGWRAVAPGIHPLQAAGADLNAAAPVLTGKADVATGIFEQNDLRTELEGLTDTQLLTRAARKLCITAILLTGELERQAQTLAGTKPKETGVLLLALTKCSQASGAILAQSHETNGVQHPNGDDIDSHPLAKSIKAWRAAAAGASRS
jgi:hypothetical protein